MIKNRVKIVEKKGIPEGMPFFVSAKQS